MNLSAVRNNFLKFAIPFGFTLIALLIGAFVLFQKNNSKNPQESAATKIFPSKDERAKLSQDIQKIKQEIIAAKIPNKGKDILLYKDAAIEIEYIPSPDIFLVKVHKEPPDTYKKQAQGWFLESGLKESGLCILPVRFVLDFKLKKANPNFSPLPDGCQ